MPRSLRAAASTVSASPSTTGTLRVRSAFSFHLNLISLANLFPDDMNPRVLKHEGFKHLDRVIDICAKHGIYTILDLHSLPGGQVGVSARSLRVVLNKRCRTRAGTPTLAFTSLTSGCTRTSRTAEYGYGRSWRSTIRETHGSYRTFFTISFYANFRPPGSPGSTS
jgi:hypothetical protein